MVSEITTFEILDNKIQRAGGKPIALEVLWGELKQSGHLLLCLYTKSGGLFRKTITRHELGRVFIDSGKNEYINGRWEVAILASEWGEKAAKKHKLTFYFPSPNDDDHDCPKWTEKHLGIRCIDCDKLMMPTKHAHLPKDICGRCQGNRKHNESIKKAEPDDKGIDVYLFKNNQYERVGYSAPFENFIFSRDKETKPALINGINVFTLEREEIMKLNAQLEDTLNQKLLEHEKNRRPNGPETTIEYKGRKHIISHWRLGDYHEVSALIKVAETMQKAMAEDYLFKVYVKKGMTTRDNSILGLVHYLSKDSTDIDTIHGHYKDVLTKTEVLETLEKLEKFGCLTMNGDTVTMQENGKHIA